MPINPSTASAAQRFAISCNSKSITPTRQLFCLNKTTAQHRIFSTQPTLSLPRMNHVKRRTSGPMRALAHRLLVMSLNPNMTKLNLLNLKSAHCKIWATPIQAIQRSSIAPTPSHVSLKKSLCALLFLIKSSAAFDSTNVKRSRIYSPTFAFSPTPMMKSLSDASSTCRSAASAIVR